MGPILRVTDGEGERERADEAVSRRARELLLRRLRVEERDFGDEGGERRRRDDAGLCWGWDVLFAVVVWMVVEKVIGVNMDSGDGQSRVDGLGGTMIIVESDSDGAGKVGGGAGADAGAAALRVDKNSPSVSASFGLRRGPVGAGVGAAPPTMVLPVGQLRRVRTVRGAGLSVNEYPPMWDCTRVF